VLRVLLHVAVLTVVCLLDCKIDGRIRELGCIRPSETHRCKVLYKHKRDYCIGTTQGFVVVLSWLRINENVTVCIKYDRSGWVYCSDLQHFPIVFFAVSHTPLVLMFLLLKIIFIIAKLISL
jgi:hypothetical protein